MLLPALRKWRKSWQRVYDAIFLAAVFEFWTLEQIAPYKQPEAALPDFLAFSHSLQHRLAVRAGLRAWMFLRDEWFWLYTDSPVSLLLHMCGICALFRPRKRCGICASLRLENLGNIYKGCRFILSASFLIPDLLLSFL